MPYAAYEATGTSVPFACSICGRKRLFPDQLVYSDDKLFRCMESCDERTAYNVDQQRAAWRVPPEPVPPMSGPPVSWEDVETEQAFIDRAYARSVQLLGWSWPGSVVVDTCDTLPYVAGSIWPSRSSSASAGPVEVSLPATGTVRLSAGASGATTRDLAARTMWQPPQAGMGYVAIDMTIGTAIGANVITFGPVTATGFPLTLRCSNASPNFQIVGGFAGTTSAPIDTSPHKIELYWFGGNGYLSIDEGVAISQAVSTANASAARPVWRLTRSTSINIDVRTMVFLGQ